MTRNPRARSFLYRMLSDLAQWAALRAYTTLAVNYRLQKRPLQQAINEAAEEAFHIARGFDARFGRVIGQPTIDAQAVDPSAQQAVNGRDAEGHGATWPNGVPPGVDPNQAIPKPGNGATT